MAMIKVTYRFSKTKNERIMEVRVFGLLICRIIREYLLVGQAEHMEW